MALHKRKGELSRINNDTGFGSNAGSYGGRFINRDGTFNMRKEGIAFLSRLSIYHTMLNMPRWKFITVVVCFYLIINLCFATVYLFIGMHQLQGWIAATPWQKFKEA